MAAIARQRTDIVPLAQGAVLELGFGSGRNLPFFDPAKVSAIVGIEPEEGMRALGQKAAATSAFPVTLVSEPIERAELAPASFDTLLVTFSLCTIPNAEQALRFAARALKPGGRLLFCEHGLAPQAQVRRLQRRIEPVWSRLAGGCRLTKHIPSVVREGGFVLEQLSQRYAPGAPNFAGYIYRGVARAAG